MKPPQNSLSKSSCQSIVPAGQRVSGFGVVCMKLASNAVFKQSISSELLVQHRYNH